MIACARTATVPPQRVEVYLSRSFHGHVRLYVKQRSTTQPTSTTTPLKCCFDLRTFDGEGVIFFAGGHLNSSWIVLAMHQGKLELQLKYGAVSRVTSSGPLVNDGQWRKVKSLRSDA
ncbi:hypothetical protein XENOCAPTIV_020857 [Xenoophorus captivus]|uniref:Laminin G domain-containing protein n=1 Tax=Xenoophorus captivus TaxID=1517983 RepID=A0ABV0S4M0_9TELE